MDNQQIAGIFRPTKSKMMLFLAFAIFNAWQIYAVNPIWPLELVLPDGGAVLHYGIPLNFYGKMAGCTFSPESKEYELCSYESLEGFPLVLDILIWYIAASLLIYIYHKVKARP
jgi:hypothetical protein